MKLLNHLKKIKGKLSHKLKNNASKLIYKGQFQYKIKIVFIITIIFYYNKKAPKLRMLFIIKIYYYLILKL